MIEETPTRHFNVDETGLLQKCTLDKIVTFKNEPCSGGKLSKNRITLVRANIDGMEKVPLLLIRKSQNPRCFKNIKRQKIEYKTKKSCG